MTPKTQTKPVHTPLDHLTMARNCLKAAKGYMNKEDTFRAISDAQVELELHSDDVAAMAAELERVKALNVELVDVLKFAITRNSVDGDIALYGSIHAALTHATASK